jgi:hypothetical protein
VALFAGCGTIPDVRALLHASVLYQDDADFVGARGPLIEEQGQRIIERLEERQQTPSDILQRHLAFEQALSDVPLVVGNKVTPAEKRQRNLSRDAGGDSQRPRQHQYRNVHILRRTDRKNVCRRANRAGAPWSPGESGLRQFRFVQHLGQFLRPNAAERNRGAPVSSA